MAFWIDVLIKNFVYEKTINFIQKTAEKIIPTDKDLMKSDIKCFGNKVGTVTNKITATHPEITNILIFFI